MGESLHFVDSNAHVAAPVEARSRYPLRPLPGTEHEWTESQAVTPEELVACMDDAGIHQAYLMSQMFHGFDCSYCADAVSRFPDRFVGVANVDIFGPDAIAQVDHWILSRGMHGLRFWPGGRGVATWVDDPRYFPVWERVRELGVPSNAHTTRPPALPATRRFLDRFGGIPFTINALGHVPYLEGPDTADAGNLLALAAYPRVYVNFSIEFLEATGQSPAARGFLNALVESFGARRLLWSNFYPGLRKRPFREAKDILLRALSAFSPDDRKWIAGEAARELYPALGRASSHS